MRWNLIPRFQSFLSKWIVCLFAFLFAVSCGGIGDVDVDQARKSDLKPGIWIASTGEHVSVGDAADQAGYMSRFSQGSLKYLVIGYDSESTSGRAYRSFVGLTADSDDIVKMCRRYIRRHKLKDQNYELGITKESEELSQYCGFREINNALTGGWVKFEGSELYFSHETNSFKMEIISHIQAAEILGIRGAWDAAGDVSDDIVGRVADAAADVAGSVDVARGVGAELIAKNTEIPATQNEAKHTRERLSAYETDCANGVVLNCAYLGYIYLLGDGVAQDDVKAARFLRKGCDGGIAISCHNFGTMYDNGRGLTQDLAEAANLYGKSCAGGVLLSCDRLGVMYSSGHGVAQNKVEADRLFLKACGGTYAQGCLTPAADTAREAIAEINAIDNKVTVIQGDAESKRERVAELEDKHENEQRAFDKLSAEAREALRCEEYSIFVLGLIGDPSKGEPLNPRGFDLMPIEALELAEGCALAQHGASNYIAGGSLLIGVPRGRISKLEAFDYFLEASVYDYKPGIEMAIWLLKSTAAEEDGANAVASMLTSDSIDKFANELKHHNMLTESFIASISQLKQSVQDLKGLKVESKNKCAEVKLAIADAVALRSRISASAASVSNPKTDVILQKAESNLRRLEGMKTRVCSDR